MNSRTLLVTAVVVGALALGGCTTKVVTTESTGPINTVTANGEGKTAAPPDTAQMFFGASIQNKNAKTALDEAGKLATAVTAAIKSAGVAEKDIQTSNISVYPEYEYTKDAPKITGYRANIQVRAELRDMATIGDVITAASDAGANEINGPMFMLSDDAEARDEAIKKAVENARARAEVMAQAAGKTVGEVISISEAGVNVPVLYQDRALYAAAEAAVPVETGELDITANVTVVFELK